MVSEIYLSLGMGKIWSMTRGEYGDTGVEASRPLRCHVAALTT